MRNMLKFVLKNCLLVSLLLTAGTSCVSADSAEDTPRFDIESFIQKDGFTLNLKGSDVTDADLEVLKDPSFLKLKVINLADTGITSRGLESFGKLQNLRMLILSNTKISDAALSHVANLRLRSLDASSTKIGDGMINYLRNMPLVFLDVRNTRVTQRGLQRLATRHSSAEIKSSTPAIGGEG